MLQILQTKHTNKRPYNSTSKWSTINNNHKNTNRSKLHQARCRRKLCRSSKCRRSSRSRICTKTRKHHTRRWRIYRIRASKQRWISTRRKWQSTLQERKWWIHFNRNRSKQANRRIRKWKQENTTRCWWNRWIWTRSIWYNTNTKCSSRHRNIYLQCNRQELQ